MSSKEDRDALIRQMSFEMVMCSSMDWRQKAEAALREIEKKHVIYPKEAL